MKRLPAPLESPGPENDSLWRSFSRSLQSFSARFDLFQVIPLLVLLAFGILFIHGTGHQVGGEHAEIFWKRQLLYAAAGLFFWFLLLFLDYRWLIPGIFLLYPLAITLLGIVLVAGTEHFNARRWLDFGPFSLQPSEIGKLAVIVGISWLLSLPQADINKLRWALPVLLLTAVPVFLIYREPDLGTSLVFLPVAGAICFAANLKLRWVAILFVLLAAAAPLSYLHLKDYQRNRIQAFLDPERDPLNRGWNAIQAELAVGRGGITGQGYMQGTHCSLGYLPKTVANSDFIFPVIAEETGFLGTSCLLLLYGVLLFSILRTALLAPDLFGRYLCVGIAALLVTHTVVNIGMCIRILPITGLPLPLVSYGGTFLVAMLVYLGIVQSVYAHRQRDSFLAL